MESLRFTRGARAIPMSDRFSRVAAFVLVTLFAPRGAVAQEAPRDEGSLVLDRDAVISLASRQAPDVREARTRVAESEALHVGARIWSTVNPEVALAVGPRWGGAAANAGLLPDFTLALVWPIDASGSPAARWRLADTATREANAAADEASWIAQGEALDLWVQALGADARVQLEEARAVLDRSLFDIARVRRSAGVVGDADVALATVIRAGAEARVRMTEGERAALIESLRARLGIAANVTLRVAGSLETTAPQPLATLIAMLARRADIVRAGDAIETARGDLDVQRRLGAPVPRVTLFGGRENEYFVHAGVEVPLPVFQRNQMHVAIAGARLNTSSTARAAVRMRAEGELRAAYARYLSSRAAVDALIPARSAAVDAEQLATRAYELGQTDLASAVLVRREAAIARVSDLDARIALLRARLAVDRAAGLVP